MILTRCQFPPHSANTAAGSQMKRSVLVWVPHHFYWIVATCFCFCCMAWSVDSRERVKEISARCNICSVLSLLLLFTVEICPWFSRQWHYISSLEAGFTNAYNSKRSLFIIVSFLRKTCLIIMWKRTSHMISTWMAEWISFWGKDQTAK